MDLLKLKKGALIKKIIKKLTLEKSPSKQVPNKSVFKKFLLHILCLLAFFILYIPISKIDSLIPITHTFKDLAFSDIYFSKIRKNTLADTASSQIYIVNIGRKDKITTRKEITRFINNINESNYKPRVIGIDVMFESFTKDSTVDINLSNALKDDNIVTICRIEEIKNRVYTIASSLKKFKTEKFGFSNQWIEKNRPLTERYFKPCFQINENDFVDHFSLKIAQLYNNDAYLKFSKRNLNNPCLINYRGDYSKKNHFDINDTTQYKLLRNKIVLVGLYEYSDNKPLYNEDLHWSPTNERYFGRSAQNIYGIEIQANIIANIINDDSITHSKSMNLLLQIILGLVIYFLLLRFYLRNKFAFTLSKLFLQLFIVGGLILLSIFQIMWFNLYLDYTPLLIIAFLSAEIIGLLEGVIEKYFVKVKHFFSKKSNPVNNDTETV